MRESNKRFKLPRAAAFAAYDFNDASARFIDGSAVITLPSITLQLTMMRISLSWSRILPDGYTNRVSSSGVAFYDNVINEMLANNITPMVSLFDNDMPYRLQQLGGWTNPVMIDIFADYANFVFTLFGHKVKCKLPNIAKHITIQGQDCVIFIRIHDI